MAGKAGSTVSSRTGSGFKLQVESVSLSYFSQKAETVALDHIDFELPHREFLSLVGPSGCGKSTLLTLIAGLTQPTSGRILVDGEPVRGTSPSIGYMLQQDYLLEWRTILDNVLLGAEIQRKRDRGTEERARALLHDYGLGKFLHHKPNELSGGMRQRAALARTMLLDPDLILLDEPFSALDSQTRLAMSDEICSILREAGKTAILVTHDIGEAIAMTDRALVLSRRPGRIRAEHRFDFPGVKKRTSLELRALPEFNAYFQTIWNELDVHEKA